jgi:hypothetical protein
MTLPSERRVATTGVTLMVGIAGLTVLVGLWTFHSPLDWVIVGPLSWGTTSLYFLWSGRRVRRESAAWAAAVRGAPESAEGGTGLDGWVGTSYARQHHVGIKAAAVFLT